VTTSNLARPGQAGHDVENPLVVVHEQKQRMLGSH